MKHPIKQLGGLIDYNVLDYVLKRFERPLAGRPCPITRFKTGIHKGKPKINPHVTTFLLPNGSNLSVFEIKPVYYLHVNGEWRPLSEVTTHHGNKKIVLNNKWEQIEPWYLRWLMKRCELIGGQVLIPWRFDNVPIREGQEIFFTVTTKYPDPNVEVTSVDGDTANVGVGSESWATIRDDTDSTQANDSSTAVSFIRSRPAASTYDVIRGFFLFDTSSITDSDTIDSATIAFAALANGVTNTDSSSLDVVASTPASNTAITTADYDQVGSTVFGTMTLASWVDTDTNYNTITLTNTSAITFTGISKFGTRNSRDTANSAPTGDNILSCYMADQAGTSTDPKLAVTHTAAAAGPMSFYMGSGFWGA